MLVRFNLIDAPDSLLDLDGIDVIDIEHARQRATAAAREIMASELLTGHLNFKRRIEIVDKAGNIVLCVPFASVVTIDAG